MIDLTKLPTAPISVEYDNDTGPGDEGFWEWWRAGSGKFTIEGEAEFYALAINAFDVMMRRGWTVVPAILDENGNPVIDGESRKWRVALPPGCVPQGWPGDDTLAPDPFTALVEADRWYKENMEGKS